MKSVLQKIKNITNASEVDQADLKEILFAILENYPEGQRNPKHLSLISQALLTIDFFKKLQDARGEDSIKLCAMLLKYEKHQFDTDVIVHGERGDKFYIILQGICEIYVPNSQGQFVKVGELKAGQSFGELALINDSPRRATIKAQTDCDLAILSKKDYIKIIADMEEREIKKKIQFLEGLPLFNQIHRRSLHEYIYYFKIVNYKWKDIVYQQGEDPQYVYIIKSGEFILQKFSRQEKNQNSGIFPITAQVAIIGPGEIFGEVDCLLNHKRHFSVSCHTQSAEVFLISKKHFSERIMDNYNIREKNFVENYLDKKIQWRNERMNSIKTVRRIAEQDIKFAYNKVSPQSRKSKKDSIQYDKNSNDQDYNYNSPVKTNRQSINANFMLTEIGDTTHMTQNNSLIIGSQNSPASFSHLGKQNKKQLNLRSLTTATPSLSKRASTAFITQKPQKLENREFFSSQVECKSTIEDGSPIIADKIQNQDADSQYEMDNNYNLGNSSNQLEALIFSSPLKNKFNQNTHFKLNDLSQKKTTPNNNNNCTPNKNINLSSQKSEPSNSNNMKELIPNNFEIEENEGMRKFLKTNSAVYKMRKLNQAKLEICRQQNIDVQGKSFKNIGIIEDVELPKYMLNKLKNQNSIMSVIQQKSQSPRIIANISGVQTHKSANSTICSPQKKRSISLANHNNNNNFSIMPPIKSDAIFDGDFKKINNILHAPLQRVENDKLKQVINQMKFLDSQQYKIQTQQITQNSQGIYLKKSNIIPKSQNDQTSIQQTFYKRSISPVSVQNKNQSVLMHKFMLTPLRQHDQNSSKLNPEFTTNWEHLPEPNQPPLIANPHLNIQNLQIKNIKL
ncbi:cyclic nucleotide-binding domain protein (macronuclear) [Tetrahymena thermophila SB210]|uniref:Cyclic nucleotide-binding domain protein n=1 Tax=Tetrahymena thermophila (strain SB210) TaxID=312017 RepID=Q22R60_TETTS|nr:cyclic nucleotide-binding domain protein [Tetrahymena thermophila SB210]EAR88262.2 cyclic nucleotide-binding domain protein [Tetrahymena thermophila SB210]|eukprot:XP_001008507.2 cyclic nucleotide-binding domain protein [Tetrahymena thermophila SB210]